MSYLEYTVKHVPSGITKVFYLNWALILLISAVASIGFLMLYSVAGGSMDPWASAQMKRFVLGFFVMLVVALVPIWYWRSISVAGYLVSLMLLVAV